jgi:FAD/FMN-containing dehydrogenase
VNTHRVALRGIQEQLPSLAWITDPARVARLSQDFYWFSPVLKSLLDGKVADAVVKPRDESQLRGVVAACAKEHIPITLRGGGTGNYGQSTPLFGGLVIDMSDLKRFCWVRDGAARAQSGIRLSDLDQQTREAGWELRCLPSTFRIASLGGLFAGGFGGIGSINYGPLGAAGTILGVSAMTVEPEPKIIELKGHEALMQQLDAVGVVDIPELRRIAGDKSHLEEVAAGGAIVQQATATGEKIGKSVVHGVVH